MAIKLYKSQLEPTAKSSNVANKAFVSMQEAGSIGRAWKGMVQSGEKLYVKHQDIKTDNEVLEKVKEVMNGSDTFEGLSATTLRASNMNDPDKAGKVYNDAWQNIFDNVNGSLSGKMAQRKFKAWMTKQNIKDVNDIKNSSTVNMINQRRVNTLDDIETLKKEIIHGTPLKSNLANQQLKENFSSQKFKEIFGNKLDGVVKSTETEIAWFQYKNVPIADQEAALAAAIKDKRIPNNEGKYSIQTLKAQFNSKKTTTNYLNKNNISSMESNMKKGYTINENEFAQAIKIASDTGDEKGLIKLSQMQIDYPIYQQLNNMSVEAIRNRVNILTNFKGKDGKGKKLEDINNLRISKEYLDKLTTSLDDDQLVTASERNIVSLDNIGFEQFLTTANIDTFKDKVTKRIAQAKTVSDFYKRSVKYFTNDEKTAIQSAFESASSSSQIINLSTGLVKAFGMDSANAFKEISKDNTFLAHVGGLVMMNNGKPGKNVKLAVDGYLLSKNPDLAQTYKMKSTDAALLNIKGKYSAAYSENQKTLNNVTEAANYIYAAQLKNAGETTKNFKASEWEEAFKMAAGAIIIDKVGPNITMGGFDENKRGNKVTIPPWLQEGKFEDVEKLLLSKPELFTKASSNGKNPQINGKEFLPSQVYMDGEQHPYFVSVGNGRYKIAMGENPLILGGNHEYLFNTDNQLFIIDLKNIKAEITTELQ
jgi:hypothetical protein